MWVIIEFNRSNEQQRNHTLIGSHEGLVKFVNSILLSSLPQYTNARLVMIPPSTSHPQQKIFPLIACHSCDFYAQWFDAPTD